MPYMGIGGRCRSLKYIERPPISALLKPHVKCIWMLRRTYSGSDTYEVLWPDGYKDILFHYGCTYHVGGEPLPASFVMGTLSRCCRLEAEGELVLYGIRLYPWGLYMICDQPVDRFNDRFLPAAELLAGKDAVRTGAAEPVDLEALERFLAGASLDDAQPRLESFLESLMDPGKSDPPLFSVIDKLYHLPGEYGVADAVRDAGLSLRQFERRCFKATGLSPKRLHVIARFNQVRMRLLVQPDLDLHDVMLEAGYYDYSHFSKDFHHCLGATPAQFQDWVRRLRRRHGPQDVEFLQDNLNQDGYDPQ